MSNAKATALFLAGAALAAALYVAMARYGDDASPSSAMCLPQGASVARVEMEGAEGSRLLAIERRETWRLVEPFSAAVDETRVMKLLDAVSFATVKDVLSERDLRKVGRTLADFGLDRPRLAVVFTGGGGLSRRIAFGRHTPTGDAVYATASEEGAKSVFVLPSQVFDAVNLTVDDLRSRSLASFDPAEVVSVDIKRGGELLRLRRAGDKWETTAPASAPASAAKTMEFLSALSAARAERFVWPSAETESPSAVQELSDALLSTYGLDAENAVTVTLKTGGGADEQISFGREAGDGLVHARSSHLHAVVCVPAALKRDALADVSVFSDDRLFPYRAEEVGAVSISSEAGTVLLSRDGGKWRIDAPLAAPADDAEVNALVERLVSLKLQDRAAKGLLVAVGTNSAPVTVDRSAVLGGSNIPSLRSRLVMSFPQDGIRRISVEREGGARESVEYNAERSAWENAVSGDGRGVTEKGVAAVVAEASSLVATSVVVLKVTIDSMREFGLEKPYSSIAFDRRGGEGMRTNLIIGSKAQGGGRYATLGASEAIFVISDESVERLLSPLLEDAAP